MTELRHSRLFINDNRHCEAANHDDKSVGQYHSPNDLKVPLDNGRMSSMARDEQCELIPLTSQMVTTKGDSQLNYLDDDSWELSEPASPEILMQVNYTASTEDEFRLLYIKHTFADAVKSIEKNAE